MQQTTDPVTREIIKNALMSTADTMALTVVRTARSAVIKHAMDFSTALFNAEGLQVAQGLTIAAHLGSMAPALQGVMNAFGDDVKPGDIFANNDPYEGGSHLPDIFLFKPIFAFDTLVGWSCCIGHQTDIGGRIPGGNASDNTELYQEGLLLPPLKLYEEGVLNQAVWRILEKNVRVPEKVIGDVQALLAAVRFGERDMLRLVEDYGLEDMKSYMTDIVDTTEALARAEIRGLPQGEWEFTDYIDNDGIDMRPIAIKAKVKIDGDTVHVDFDGTSPQAKGSINPNIWYTKSCVYAAMKCLIDPSIQANSGFFRAFDIQAPEGCFVNPQHPAPVAARGLSGFRICQAILGAMAQAMPGQVPGMWGGGEVGLSFGGYDENRKGWVYLEFQNDGPRGGGPWMDGADGAACAVNNLANTPNREHRGGPAPAHRAVLLRSRHRRGRPVPGRPGHDPGLPHPGGGVPVPAPHRPARLPAMGRRGRKARHPDPQLHQPRDGGRGRASGQAPHVPEEGRPVPPHPGRRRRVRRPAGEERRRHRRRRAGGQADRGPRP